MKFGLYGQALGPPTLETWTQAARAPCRRSWKHRGAARRRRLDFWPCHGPKSRAPPEMPAEYTKLPRQQHQRFGELCAASAVQPQERWLGLPWTVSRRARRFERRIAVDAETGWSSHSLSGRRSSTRHQSPTHRHKRKRGRPLGRDEREGRVPFPTGGLCGGRGQDRKRSPSMSRNECLPRGTHDPPVRSPLPRPLPIIALQ